MMRAVLFVVIVAVLLLIAALATGLLRFSSGMGSRTETAANATAAAHQSRSFDVETGSVHVGSRSTTVKVPRLEVTPPANTASNQAANGSDHQ
jgi:flagellar basal body-associated protein FliL